MPGVLIDLSDVGTTREVLLSAPPRGVRNLIVVAAVVLVAVTVALGFLPVQQTQTINGLAVAVNQPRTVVATQVGMVGAVGAVDGATVEAGQSILTIDMSNAKEQLAVLQREQDQNTSDIAGYQQLRQAVLDGGNPFDPASQTSLHYSLVEYQQNLAQAADNAKQTMRQQTSTRNQAQAALAANQDALNGVGRRINQLSSLARSVRDGSAYSSTDDYCEALYRSWRAGRPNAGSTTISESPQGYDAAFVAQVEGQIVELQAQHDSYSTQVAQLRSQLNQPVLDPAADPEAAITADFMLSVTSAEQQLQTEQAALTLQIMGLQLKIDQSDIVAPVAGVLETPFDWRVGDQVQAGQQVFRVVPPSTTRIEALVPPGAIAAIAVGRLVPCSVANDPAGRPAGVSCRVDAVPGTFETAQDGQMYYAVRLSVEPGSDLAGYGTELPAGLPVSLTIPVRQSSALRWIVEKIGLVKQA